MATVLSKRPSCPVQNSFEAGVPPAHRGLAQRLGDGALLPKEKQALDRTIAILGFRAKSMSLREIATEIGTSEAALKKFSTRGVFRTIVQFLRAQESAPDAHINGARKQAERAEWNGLAVKSLDYYRDAFARDATGAYVSVERAERAAGLVAKGQGWLESEAPAPKPQTLKLGVIQAAMHAIAASDRGETVVRLQLEVATKHDDERPLASDVAYLPRHATDA